MLFELIVPEFIEYIDDLVIFSFFTLGGTAQLFGDLALVQSGHPGFSMMHH